MFGIDHAVTSIYVGAFHYRQKVTLHALTRNFRASASRLASCHLVYLVEKHDAGILRFLDRGPRYLVHIDEILLFLTDQIASCFSNLHLATDRLRREHVAEHIFKIYAHFFHSLPGYKIYRRVGAFLGIELDKSVVKAAPAKLVAQLFASAARR